MPADAGLTSKVLRAALAMGLPIFLGRIASGDRFLAHRHEADEVRRIFAADAVEMEGAAALWTARRMGMPMALLRIITDQAGSEAPSAFETFLDSASERLAGLIGKVLSS
jgi:adenosylhomocysteine nucleosidase